MSAPIFRCGDRDDSSRSSDRHPAIRLCIDSAIFVAKKRLLQRAQGERRHQHHPDARDKDSRPDKLSRLPRRIVISAANPLKPGMPIEAADAMTKVKAANGRARASPMLRERVEIARVGAAINHAAGHGEEQGRDHAVRKHLQDRAADAERVGRGQPEQDEAHVADAGIADDEFQVALPQRHRRGVNDPDDTPSTAIHLLHVWNPSGKRFMATRNAA